MHFNAVTLYSIILEKCKNLILTNSEEKNCMLHLSEFFSFTFLVQINFYLSMESQLCFIYSTSRYASQPIIAYMFQKSKSNICLKKGKYTELQIFMDIFTLWEICFFKIMKNNDQNTISKSSLFSQNVDVLF